MQHLNTSTIKKMKGLREKGFSLSEISKELHVAKSTASRYAHSVQVLPEYESLLRKKKQSSKKVRGLKLQQALEEAEKLITNLSDREKILLLTALYWAEGSKKDFGLSNTDPDLVRVYVAILRDLFHIPDGRFRVSIRIYEDLDREACLQFWSKVVKIPKEKFVSVNILPGKKKGKLQYGMCRIRVSKGEELLKKIQAIYFVIGQRVPIA